MSALPSPAWPLLTRAGHREVEAQHAAAHPQDSLMRRAATAAQDIVRECCTQGGRVLILAGPGNNGGDAWVLAALLKRAWFNVVVVANAVPLAAEAREAYDWLIGQGVRPGTTWPTGSFDLIVDGLYGIGCNRPPDAWSATLINTANGANTPVLALDIPSGLDADSGVAYAPCIVATHTISFIAGKPGLFTADGPDHVGQVHVSTLGTQPNPGADQGTLLDDANPLTRLPTRKKNSHKGTFGSVGIVGGAPGMAGAGLLAGRAALRSGAGKVLLGLLDEAVSVDPGYPEIMVRKVRDVLRQESLAALAIGPGLGLPDPARALLTEALKANIPILLDADALNLLAQGKALQTQLRRRTAATIITPHPAEAARLLGCTTAEINTDRLSAARKLAADFQATVVLKGVGSIVCAPTGQWFINSTGNPGMASGGMGDVLTGIIAALLGQGLAPLHAACLGTWVHGRAADVCVANGTGPVGLLASDLIARLPRCLSDRQGHS